MSDDPRLDLRIAIAKESEPSMRTYELIDRHTGEVLAMGTVSEDGSFDRAMTLDADRLYQLSVYTDADEPAIQFNMPFAVKITGFAPLDNGVSIDLESTDDKSHA